MNIPTFTISEHAARTEGEVVSTYEEVSGLRGMGKDVAIISWLPPRFFFTVDDAMAPDDESFFTRASILAWQEELQHLEKEYVNGSTGIDDDDDDDDYDETSLFSELERLYYVQKREEMRSEWKRLTTERRLTIERAPFAYTTQGIVVANWTGSHQHWKRAWKAALAVVGAKFPWWHSATRDSNIMDELYRGHREYKHLVTIRHELSALTGERHLVPDTYRLTTRLMSKVFKENPNARLKPFYVLTNIENEDVARLVMQRLYERMIRPWFIALAQSPDDEAYPWISLQSKHQLLSLVSQGRFFVFEFLRNMSFSGQPPGTVAYAPILSAEMFRNGRPLGIGIALRKSNTLGSDFYRIDGLVFTFLHEMGHVLDSGDPKREVGTNTALQHQPGKHDRDWKRAFQYALNIAFRIGLIKNESLAGQGENWTIADFDKNFDAYITWHSAKPRDVVSPSLLRQELKNLTPGGMKRTREEGEDSQGGGGGGATDHHSHKTSVYLS